jgi:hypothetical protein
MSLRSKAKSSPGAVCYFLLPVNFLAYSKAQLGLFSRQVIDDPLLSMVVL